MPDLKKPFFTIGHSTRTIEEFVGLLKMSGVVQLIDVRTVPRSRTNPQYNLEVLGDTLGAYQISYHHLAKLGGLRGKQHKSDPVVTRFWRNPAFQNYADYTRTPEFRSGMEALTGLGRAATSAIMCAEAVWWRCHRRIIADHLLAQGETVFHIMGEHSVVPASLTLGARVEGQSVIYPDADKSDEAPPANH
jgi:uncharacterized protein (DUF488 family)